MGSAVNNSPELDTDNKEESPDRSNDEEIEDLEWSPDQEVLLLYSLHGLKPVGPHKHFRMIVIQDRFSNAMNKIIPPAVIWRKLSTLYDMEALDESEMEGYASTIVDIDFKLPLAEYGELLKKKKKKLPVTEPRENSETDIQKEIQIESDTSSQDHKAGLVSSDGESSKESDSSKGVTSPKASGKETHKRGAKRTLTPVKDAVSQKKDNSKEAGKKDTPKKEESKKGQGKEEDKKEAVKKGLDFKKDEKKDDGNKMNKKDSTSKKLPEQTKKEVETKKSEQKKLDSPKNQKETPKQLRTDSSKRGETKTTRSETPKQKTDSKKEPNSDKKKEVEKKIERKSPEKTPESARGGKLRGRKETDSQKLETPAGTKRTKESKANESQLDDPPTKKTKGRPTRNSMEPQKSTGPATSPQKRRTRLL